MAVGPGAGETIRSPIGGDVTFIARGQQTNGAFTVLDVSVPPGEGPPLHVHGREDEYVGCDLAQGFHLSRGLPGDELLRWCDAHVRSLAAHGRPLAVVSPPPARASAA
jgi:hypothetical protein